MIQIVVPVPQFSFRERDGPAVQFAARVVDDDVLAAAQQQVAQRCPGPLVNRGVRGVGEAAVQVARNAGQPVMHWIQKQLLLSQNVPGRQVLRRGRQQDGPAPLAAFEKVRQRPAPLAVVAEIVRRVNQNRRCAASCAGRGRQRSWPQ